MKSLQVNVNAIEQALRKVRPETVKYVLDQVTVYELSIPRIEAEVDEQQIYERMKGRWENIRKWFAGADGVQSEAMRVFDTTNEVIRKITRYANRLSEQNNSGANRREEYRKLAGMFAGCKDIDEAHKLAAMVFGIEKPLHIKGISRGRRTASTAASLTKSPRRLSSSPVYAITGKNRSAPA